jgi:hypothetical protein
MTNTDRTNEWLARRSAGLEVDAISKEKIGRDPRAMSTTDLEAVGHKPMAVLDALRARCLDCCAGSASEVRKCVAVECPSWPFRMGWNPWRERKELSVEQRAEMGARLAQSRAAKKAQS